MMQTAVVTSEPVVLFQRPEPVAAPSSLQSGFWGVREPELDGVELAAAIALVVHRGVLASAPRRVLPVRGY